MNILIVDDEQNIRMTLKDILQDEGFQIFTASNGEKALKIIAKNVFDLIILDVKMPGLDGIEVFKKIHESQPDLDVLIISGHGDIETAVRAVKLGAYDFLEKPLSMNKILTVARNIQDKLDLKTSAQQGVTLQSEKYQLVGQSPQIEDLKQLIQKVGPADSKILIRGESGTGKELVAFAIHSQSNRKNRSFIKFNSAAIPSELVESELFGYERGAFTGANVQKTGKLEQANGGTLLFDEIGDMSLIVQAKILRVIQEGTFERVGGNKTIHIDVRILAATHKDLEAMVKNHTFREDLFYRLNVIPVNVPPLRDRIGDIETLVDHFLGTYAKEFNVWKKTMLPSALELLSKYSFPGNVRELKNLIERLHILVNNDFITEEDLKPHLLASPQSNMEVDISDGISFKDVKKDFEKKYLRTLLKKYNWNISKVAKRLSMQQPNLSRKIKDLEINRDE